MLQPENNHSGYCSSSNGSFSEYSETDSSTNQPQRNIGPRSRQKQFSRTRQRHARCPKWLKSLHYKYQFLFAKLTYEEMLALDEDKLKSDKRSRNKILENVVKLREQLKDSGGTAECGSSQTKGPERHSDPNEKIVQTLMRQGHSGALYTNAGEDFNQLHNQLPFIFHQYHQHQRD